MSVQEKGVAEVRRELAGLVDGAPPLGFTADDMVRSGRRARRTRWAAGGVAVTAVAVATAFVTIAAPFGGDATVPAATSPSDDLVASPGPGGELVERYRALPPPAGPPGCATRKTMDRFGAAVVEQVKEATGPRGPVTDAMVTRSLCLRNPPGRPEDAVEIRIRAGGETETLRVGVTYRSGEYRQPDLCAAAGALLPVPCHEPEPTPDRIRVIQWIQPRGSRLSTSGVRVVRTDDRLVTVLENQDGRGTSSRPLIDAVDLSRIALAQGLAAYAG
jgi:hypothetical protein